MVLMSRSKDEDKVLTTDEREQLEDSIMDAHLAADKYLESGKEVHRKLLEVSVTDALEYIELLSAKLKEDPKKDNYKLHLMVPLQLVIMLELENHANDN